MKMMLDTCLKHLFYRSREPPVKQPVKCQTSLIVDYACIVNQLATPLATKIPIYIMLLLVPPSLLIS